jgi:hypothetical protein
MKLLIISILVIAIIGSCQQEVTNNNTAAANSPQIASATVANSMRPNTKISGYLLDSGIIEAPVAGINLRFDYTNVPAGTPWNDSLKSPGNLTDYPAATYMTGLNQNILGQSIAVNQYFGLSSASWDNLGGHSGTDINLNISGYSLSVPRQAAKKNPVQTLVNFPIKYNDSIKQVCSSAFTIQIGGTINGININGPLTTTTTTTVSGKNIAYGYLKLRGYTDSMQVIVQRYSTAVKTTFSSSNIIINSLPAIVLDQLNLPNDQTTYITEYRYWAKDKGLVLRREGNGVAYVRTGL